MVIMLHCTGENGDVTNVNDSAAVALLSFCHYYLFRLLNRVYY